MSHSSVPDRRTRVWITRFADRTALQLQWVDPDTTKVKTQSSRTDDPDRAETARADLECRLNDGNHASTVRVSWARFREEYERDYLSGRRDNTRLNHKAAL